MRVHENDIWLLVCITYNPQAFDVRLRVSVRCEDTYLDCLQELTTDLVNFFPVNGCGGPVAVSELAEGVEGQGDAF